MSGKEVHEGLVGTVLPSLLDDYVHHIGSHVLDGCKTIEDFSLVYRELGFGSVDGRRDNLDSIFRRQVQVFLELVWAVHFVGKVCSQEFSVVVGLKKGCLVGYDGVCNGMGLVESISCKRLQHVEDLFCVLLCISLLYSSSLELHQLLCQGVNLLLTHDTSQDICFSKSVSCNDLGCLHDLLLIDDDSVGGLQDRLQGRVWICDWSASPLGVDVFGDELHRTGPVEGIQGYQLFDGAGLGLLQNILHA